MWNWLISNNGGGGACSRLYMDTYRADCEWGDWGGSCQDYADVPPDEMTSATWQHVAITYDGTTLVGYRNGVEIARNDPDLGVNTCATDATTTEYSDGFSSGYTFHIGATHALLDSSNPNYHGQIDEVTVYGIALSAAEIAAVYNDGAGLDLMGQPPPPLPMATACSEHGEAYTLTGCEVNVCTRPTVAAGLGWRVDSGGQSCDDVCAAAGPSLSCSSDRPAAVDSEAAFVAINECIAARGDTSFSCGNYGAIGADHPSECLLQCFRFHAIHFLSESVWLVVACFPPASHHSHATSCPAPYLTSVCVGCRQRRSCMDSKSTCSATGTSRTARLAQLRLMLPATVTTVTSKGAGTMRPSGLSQVWQAARLRLTSVGRWTTRSSWTTRRVSRPATRPGRPCFGCEAAAAMATTGFCRWAVRQLIRCGIN